MEMDTSVRFTNVMTMEAVFVTTHGQIFVTRGLKNAFRLWNKPNANTGAQQSVA